MLFVDEFCGILVYIKFGADVTSQYVDTAGKNASRIAEYIANQLKEDELGEQLTMSELGPFTGGK